MDLKDIIKKSDFTIKDLEKIQEIYDKKFVDEKFRGFERVRHTTLHMGKLLGKLSNYCEKIEHGEEYSSKQIQEEVIPDLIVYSLWLSEVFGVKPDKAYLKRIVNNIENMYLEKSSKEEVEDLKNLIDKKY